MEGDGLNLGKSNVHLGVCIRPDLPQKQPTVGAGASASAISVLTSHNTELSAAQ
jgi:hypothetical protein